MSNAKNDPTHSADADASGYMPEDLEEYRDCAVFSEELWCIDVEASRLRFERRLQEALAAEAASHAENAKLARFVEACERDRGPW